MIHRRFGGKEIGMMKSNKDLIKHLLVGIIDGAVMGTVAYVIGLYLGITSLPYAGIIGGIVGADIVASNRKAESRRP
jgi:hypothetical protein